MEFAWKVEGGVERVEGYVTGETCLEPLIAPFLLAHACVVVWQNAWLKPFEKISRQFF